MKKFLVLALALAAALSLTSCALPAGNIELPAYLESPYSFTASYAAEGLAGDLIFTKNGPEDCELKFLSPDTVKDMTLYLKAGMVTTEFYGIKYEGKVSDFPQFSPIAGIYGVLTGTGGAPTGAEEDSATGDVTYRFADGSLLVCGTERPKSIDIPAMGITVTITEFKAI